MRYIALSILILAFTFAGSAQTPSGAVLATVGTKKFTAEDLPENFRDPFLKIGERRSTARASLFEIFVNGVLLESAAAEKGVTVDQLLEGEILPKLQEPTEDQIKAAYKEFKEVLGDASLEASKESLVNYLVQTAVATLRDAYVAELKKKYEPKVGKDINAPILKPTDVILTVGAKTYNAKAFEDKFRNDLYEFEMDTYEAIKGALDDAIFNYLVGLEAAALKIRASDLIANEITNKLKDYTDEERELLQSQLRKRLFTKYQVVVAYKEPVATVYKIDVTGEPFEGPASAPITVVVFSDFQCPTCALTHPALKIVIADFPAKIKLVIKDFPLETIHPNAFGAAVAAGAAARQGKFFDYIDILYLNQDKLDRQSLISFAKGLGLDLKKFEADLSDPAIVEEIQQDISEGKEVEVGGTPTIFVNGVRVRGTGPIAIRAALDKALAKTPRTGVR